MDIKEVTVTTKELASLFGVADKYISQLVDLGMSKIAHNTFNLFDCITWRFENIKQSHDREKKDIREENTRSRLDRVQAELKELELAEKQGKLIPADIYEFSKINDATIYAKSLDALQTKLPPLVTGITDQQKVYEIIKKETDNIRTQVANIPADIHAELVNFDLS